MNENEFNPIQEEPVAEAEVAEVKVTEAEAAPVKQTIDRRSPMEIIIAATAVVLIVAMLAAMVMGGFGSKVELQGTSATIPADGNPGNVTCKGSYTVSDEAVVADANKVVATLGDKELTNAQLQIYYWMQVVSFLNDYSAYASAFGLDYTQPLDTQSCMMVEGQTWQQYFLESALSAWYAYESLAQEAIAAGFDQQSEDYQTYAAAVREEVRASAESYGFASIEEMLADIVGVGSNEDAYIDYMQTYYLGYLYFNTLLDERMPTDEDVEAYFEENAEEYAANGLDKNTGKYIDIRHILIMPQGGYTDESGATTYTEAEWEAARVEAQGILDQWLAGEATEDSFAILANTYSDDSDGTDGGLYTDVYEGQMVTEFNDWCFDKSREVGDYGLVKTTYGYHVMYFSGSNPIWFATAKSDLETDIANAIVPEAQEKYEVSYDYDSMVLGYVELG